MDSTVTTTISAAKEAGSAGNVPVEGLFQEPGLEPQISRTDKDVENYPEGGMDAWLVVVGAWCAMIPSMGILNTVGVLQAWMTEHQLKGYTESSIGWIVSAYAFFLYIGAAQIGKSRPTHMFHFD